MFGHIVSRNLDKQLVRLLNIVSSEVFAQEQTNEAVIISVALMREFGQAGRAYSEECKAILPALSDLATRCKHLNGEVDESSSTISQVGEAV